MRKHNEWAFHHFNTQYELKLDRINFNIGTYFHERTDMPRIVVEFIANKLF